MSGSRERRQRRDPEDAEGQHRLGDRGGVVTRLDGDHDSQDTDRAAAHQPLQLLAPLTRRAPVARRGCLLR